MTTDNFTDIQLDMLSRRWQEDPSPRLTLQLADLYRRRGQLGAAVPVLERGLEAHPKHVSLQVALGRYRLEAGDASTAASVLRSVVDQDPAHLVANKLLVRAYLGLEDLQRAGDRLELYAVLNDSDPELGTLRAAVAGQLPAMAASAAPPLPESFLTGTGAEATELSSVSPPRERSLTGALDREPFAALYEEPLEPAPLSTLFGLEVVGDEFEAWEELEVSALAEEPKSELSDQDQGGVGEREVAPEPEEIDAGATATATLGALYLAQGHLDDAWITFEQVLERDPEDAEASAGLEEIERRLGTDKAASEPAVSGSNRGKIALLRDYLGRIRAAADGLSG